MSMTHSRSLLQAAATPTCAGKTSTARGSPWRRAGAEGEGEAAGPERREVAPGPVGAGPRRGEAAQGGERAGDEGWPHWSEGWPHWSEERCDRARDRSPQQPALPRQPSSTENCDNRRIGTRERVTLQTDVVFHRATQADHYRRNRRIGNVRNIRRTFGPLRSSARRGFLSSKRTSKLLDEPEEGRPSRRDVTDRRLGASFKR